jgi:hypothetical protein
MRLKPELKGAMLALLGVVLVFIGIWVFIGLRFGLWTTVEYDRYLFLTEHLKVAHDLWHREIKAGDDVEELIKNYRPHEIERFDGWAELRWFPDGPSKDTFSFVGMYVLAKDGRLVFGSSYTDDGIDDRIFFYTLTPATDAEYHAAMKSYILKREAEKKKATQQISTNQNQTAP